MTCFQKEHRGGKDEVAFNLLRGFEKNGVSKQMLCFCLKELEPTILEYAPNINTCIVPKLNFGKDKIKGKWILDSLIFSIFLKLWLHKNEVGALLFANKLIRPYKCKANTMVITHDIKCFNGISDDYSTPSFKIKMYFKRCVYEIKYEFKNRNHIIAISDFDKSEINKYMPYVKDKVKRIYDPICFDKLEIKDIIGNDYLTVLNIQWTHKNVETVIKTFASIKDKIKQKLILVGRFPSNIEYLKKLVVDLKVEDRVIFTGFVSTKELNEIVDKTRIYINASYFEGFGMTAVEMMGRGIPTIVADNTSQKEVTKGLCRYFEPTDDYNALADVILEELNNPMSKEQLQYNAKVMRECYSYENIAKEYWDYVLECINNK